MAKRQAEESFFPADDEVDAVRRGVKRLCTEDGAVLRPQVLPEPLDVDHPFTSVMFAPTASPASAFKHAQADALRFSAKHQGSPVLEGLRMRTSDASFSQHSLSLEESPTRPPLPEIEDVEGGGEGSAGDYAEVNQLLRSLHFERLSRLQSQPQSSSGGGDVLPSALGLLRDDGPSPGAR